MVHFHPLFIYSTIYAVLGRSAQPTSRRPICWDYTSPATPHYHIHLTRVVVIFFQLLFLDISNYWVGNSPNLHLGYMNIFVSSLLDKNSVEYLSWLFKFIWNKTNFFISPRLSRILIKNWPQKTGIPHSQHCHIMTGPIHCSVFHEHQLHHDGGPYGMPPPCNQSLPFDHLVQQAALMVSLVSSDCCMNSSLPKMQAMKWWLMILGLEEMGVVSSESFSDLKILSVSPHIDLNASISMEISVILQPQVLKGS